jgi:Protein of unknown function (DUF2806)
MNKSKTQKSGNQSTSYMADRDIHKNEIHVHLPSVTFAGIFGKVIGLDVNNCSDEVLKKILLEIGELRSNVNDLKKLNISMEATFMLNLSEKREEYIRMFAAKNEAESHILPIQSNEPKNEDSIKAILDISKNISDSEVRTFIAKTLAGEFNAPNSVSRKTISIVNLMGKKELDLFKECASFMIWNCNYSTPSKIFGDDIHDVSSQKFRKSYEILSDLGLVTTKVENQFVNVNEKFVASFKDDSYEIEINCEDDTQFGFGGFRLTLSGIELINFVQIEYNDVFIKKLDEFVSSVNGNKLIIQKQSKFK